jgi:hypothetical protein
MHKPIIAGACLLAALVAAGPASALTLVATSTAPAGTLRYEGLGDIGGGIGSGRYFLGDCSFDGTDTSCLLSGSYVESAGSGHEPGATGSFEMVMRYAGNGPNPVLARSRTPGSDELQLMALGSGSFALTLTPDDGGSFAGVFPAVPFTDSIGWSAFLTAGAVCTGLGAGQACGVGQVGLTAGATIQGGVSPFVFSLPLPDAPPPIPEPATWALMLAGLAATAAGAGRRRVQRRA